LKKSIIPGIYKDDLSTYLFGVSYTTNNNVTSGFIWSDCYIDFTSQGNHLYPVTKTSKYTSVDWCTFMIIDNVHIKNKKIKIKNYNFVFMLQNLVCKKMLNQ
jgi:hypothetical protein